MQRIVINTSVGSFAVSLEGIERYLALGGTVSADELEFARERGYGFELGDYDRADPRLVRVVEELGGVANGDIARLRIVEVPDDVEWTVETAETGVEWIAEKHRTWGRDQEMRPCDD